MKKKLLSLLSVILFIGTLSAQTNIYVSAYTGNDADDGNSWKTAYRTIDTALDRIGNQSGTFNIYVAQGYYLLEDNDGNGGNDSNVYVFSNDATINIYGGYASPPVNGTQPAYNPIEYVAAFNTQGTATDSAFEVDNANVDILFKDISILDAEQGDEANGAFMNLTNADGSSVTFDNVNVYEWAGANTVTERGFIYVRSGSNNIDINVYDSLFERNDNDDGAGQFIMVGNGSADVDMHISNSEFRNIRGTGLNAALFYFNLTCNTDQGQSSILIENSEFYNIKRGVAEDQAPAILDAVQVPSVILRGNTFQGNRGGEGGVIKLNQSGYFLSENNLYQDNFGGRSGGAVYVLGSYPNCNNQNVTNEVIFRNDTFISNVAGNSGAIGRGGAIMVSGDNVGAVISPKKVTIEDSDFFDNQTDGSSGGAVFVNTSEDLTVRNSTFCENVAHRNPLSRTTGRGGAIFASGSGSMIVDNSTFVDNFAVQNAGAIHVRKDNLDISNCSYFSGNSTENGDGGAIVGYELDYSIDGAYFLNNTANTSGGAISINALGTNVGTINNANFEDNIAGNSGGALSTNSETTITNTNFERNKANNTIILTGGGAIFSQDLLSLANVNFQNNESAEDGGAIMQINSNLPSVLTESTFDYVNFENNVANNNGGALAVSLTTLPTNITNSFFIGNTSQTGDGGAIHMNEQSLDFNNNIFDGNAAQGGNAGAIWMYSGVYNDAYVQYNKFKANTANEFGGALVVDYIPTNSTEVFINHNDFLSNSAIEKGGAIAILDQGATYEVDELTYNRFYGNLLNGSDSNTNIDERSDIYLRNGGGLYTGNMRTFDYNQLQFEPTGGFNSGNYPNGTVGTGYLLGSNNTGPQASFDITYTPFSFPNLLPVCEALGCVTKEPTKVSPVIRSANGINTNTVADYTSYTDVTVNPDCSVTPTEVAFTARSNRSPDINGNIIEPPIPELLITYDVIITNNLTGEVLPVITGQVIDGDDASTYTRSEDPAEEIEAADANGPRDVYKTYFLNVTDDLESGFTYTYTITQVVVKGNPNETFDFVQGEYVTTIVTEFCDSDEDGIYNHLETTSNIDPLGDDDGDGIPNYQDPDLDGFVDANGDGINDNFDTDGDGQPNFLDIDADNDGILDNVESGIDPNDPAGNDVPIDTDGDGVPDFLDLDSDNDSINDVDEGNPDAQDLDGDGMVDGPYGDNGLADSLENGDDTFAATVTDPTDSNNDGTPDYQSTDSDGDGTPDIIDTDPYGTGEVPQSQDPSADADNNGVIDTIEDTDGDGIIDAYDVDVTGGSDTNNNGKDDAAEAELNPSEPDMDGDGIVDAYDPDADGDGIMDVVDSNPAIFGEAKDTDGDGIPNYAESPNGVDPLEEDEDNDGIPDYMDPDTPGFVDENNDGIDDNYDTDGDGRPDFLDLDSDNDGIPDSVEAGDDPANPVDTDGDSVPDYLDLDSDNDSINDIDEAGGTDADGDGMVDNFTDVDQDGLHDPIDNQDLAVPNGETPINNGTPLPVTDTDGDGAADYTEIDSDNDGTFDISDTTPYGPGSTAPQSQDSSADQNNDGIVDDTTDTDGDGIMDYVDGMPNEFGDAPEPDTDGDGIPDKVEIGPDPSNPVDTDGDGVPDYKDLDSDNDGIPDNIEAGADPNSPVDTDGDGVPDYRDLDSDNDSINDIDESGGTDNDGDGLIDNFTDTDGDGLHDPIDNQDPATPTGQTPVNDGTPVDVPDTDGDGTPDYQDLTSNGTDYDIANSPDADQDANGDGVVDSTVDNDGDGIMDVVDTDPENFGEAKDSDGDGIPNHEESPNGQDPLSEDEDGDGIPDYKDPDTPGFVDENNDGIDDNYDTDGDGRPDFLDLDADNDGIPDSVEAGDDPANPVDTDGDSVPDYLDLDSDNDSINDIDEAGGTDADGDGMVDGFTDVDQDGLHDPIDNQDLAVPNGETPINNGTPLPVPDTDGDGLADYRDLDSDGDGTFDIVDDTPYGPGSEAPISQDPSADMNNDGIVDDTTDTDGDGIMDYVDGKPNEFGDAPKVCEIDGNSGTNGRTTRVGITTLDRNVQEWLPDGNNIGAYIILESKEKGFVVPRMTTAEITNNIGENEADGVEEGMVVWDTSTDCLKMFFDHDDDDSTPMTWACISVNTCRNLKQ